MSTSSRAATGPSLPVEITPQGMRFTVPPEMAAAAAWAVGMRRAVFFDPASADPNRMRVFLVITEGQASAYRGRR